MFEVTTFVQARLAFDHGRGPADAWDRLHVLSMRRLRELAERDGAASWAMLIGPLQDLANPNVQAKLAHTLRSTGYGHIGCRVYWQSPSACVWSSAVVVPRLPAQLAGGIGERQRQLAVVQVTTAPARLEVVNIATWERIGIDAIDAVVVADTLAEMFDAVKVAMEYVPIGWFEGLAFHLAERRLRPTPSRP